MGFVLPSHSIYWDYAMTIRLEDIVYLHCHQQGKRGASSATESALVALSGGQSSLGSGSTHD